MKSLLIHNALPIASIVAVYVLQNQGGYLGEIPPAIFLVSNLFGIWCMMRGCQDWIVDTANGRWLRTLNWKVVTGTALVWISTRALSVGFLLSSDSEVGWFEKWKIASPIIGLFTCSVTVLATVLCSAGSGAAWTRKALNSGLGVTVGFFCVGIGDLISWRIYPSSFYDISPIGPYAYIVDYCSSLLAVLTGVLLPLVLPQTSVGAGGSGAKRKGRSKR
jgi:hypothetical protein